MSRQLATIRVITAISPIPDADQIELVHIDGWQCVVKKDSFKVGDPCVYFEVDSYLPIEPRYEFLRKGSYKKIPSLLGARGEGFRLKTRRIRGALSQGLALPLSEFPELNGIAGDVTEALHIELYDPPVPACLKGTAKGHLPSFVRQTDEERIQNMTPPPGIYEVSEKVDGTSMSVFFNAGAFGVCQRNYELLETEDNSLCKEARRLNLEALMREYGKNIVIQGELAGEGIGKNRLGLKGVHFYVFNIFDIDNHQYLPSRERLQVYEWFASHCSISHVPIIDTITLPSVPEILAMADGVSVLNPNKKREGLVFKADSGCSFKAISNAYLLEHGL
jgi:RNA ligase (TIGR02306 family)